MCHQKICSAVDSSFQYHFVSRIAELGTPAKMDFDWFDQICHIPHQQFDVSDADSMYSPLLWTTQCVFVFQK